jgi:hypothetical protein
MKKTLAIVIAATALTGVLGIPAWSAMGLGAAAPRPATLLPEEIKGLLLLVDDDDHEEHEDEDEDDDEEDDDDCGRGKQSCSGAGNPAPAGSVPPPSNGLFGNGAPPKVHVN